MAKIIGTDPAQPDARLDARIAAAGGGDAWTGARVRLRAYEPEDWTSSALFDETPDQRSSWRLHPPRSAFAARKSAEEAAARQPEDGDGSFPLIITATQDATVVGRMNVHSVEQVNGTFSYGIGILPAYKGQGCASEAILLVLRYMFEERRFQKCEPTVLDYNTASLQLHRKLGFVEEGRRRRHVFSGGRFHDEVLFGMTVEEYRERYPLLRPVL